MWRLRMAGGCRFTQSTTLILFTRPGECFHDGNSLIRPKYSQLSISQTHPPFSTPTPQLVAYTVTSRKAMDELRFLFSQLAAMWCALCLLQRIHRSIHQAGVISACSPRWPTDPGQISEPRETELTRGKEKITDFVYCVPSK